MKVKRGDHDAAGTKLGPLPPRDGEGSSGSWRERDIDTTHAHVVKRGDHDVESTKYGAEHAAPIVQRMRPANGNLKPMRFVSLHHHSTLGSYLDAVQLPDAHVRRATELGIGAMVMTEHGNIDSHARFDLACEKHGVKPLFGCEVYMPTGVDWYKPETRTQMKHHLTLVAGSQEGYLNLLQLVTRSWTDFYYEPTVTWENLLTFKDGIYVLSGCQGSLLFCSTVGGKWIEPEQASYRRGLQVARAFKREFGARYFIEVQAFPELEQTNRFNKLAPRLARAVGTRLVATMDCHYTQLEEAEVQKILHNLRPGNKRTIEEQARDWGYKAPLCLPLNDNTIYRRLRGTGLSHDEAVEAIVSTEEIGQQCSAELPRLPMVRFPVPEEFPTALDYWRHQMKLGWLFRKMDKRPLSEQSRYKRRLAYEMKLIESKDFVDYFLLVQAGVVHIKDLGIPVGPARGSAAASVAAWLLRITEVDPLRPEFEGLLRFERFISEDREDLPDIDLDFPSGARPLLRQFYVELMGGEDRVNNVGTFTQFKGKNSLDDVAKVFGVPTFEVSAIKDFLIERSSGDMRASSTIEDTVAQFDKPRSVIERYPDLKKAAWLEGNIKAFGVHAAALILSNNSITDVTTIAEREIPKGSGNWVTCVSLDKKDAERMGMVKMDFLGLNTMSMIWNALEWTGRDLDWLYGMPLDDPRVYALLQDVDVTGVFQFEGRAQRYVCSMIKPEKFSEIMDCNALCRPGPLHNGAAKMYGDIKQGGKVVIPRHPVLADLLGKTQYQIVYQEQILEIARVVGDFDAKGVGEIRTIIAKKEGEQAFMRKRDEFVKGALGLHDRSAYPPMSAELAREIWGDMVTSGAYAFNAAHCAAYGLISYYTAWLKVHEPDVLYAGALAESVKDKERTRLLLRDADKHGVRVLKPNLNRSAANWKPEIVYPERMPGLAPVIRPGFQSVEGIGERSAPVIEAWVKQRRPTGWGDLQELRGYGAKTVLKITDWIKAEDPFGAFKLDEDVRDVKRQLEARELRDKAGDLLPIPTHTAADLALAAESGRSLQVYWLGTFVQRNIRDLFEQNRARGVELDPASIKDPDKSEWAMLTGEDETDQLLIKIDRMLYAKKQVKEAVFNFKMGQDLLLVEGVKPARSGVRSLTVKKLWVIRPDEEE